jgi:hypothetical protein
MVEMGYNFNVVNMENRIDEDLYCHYSDLPSPMAYVGEKCMDYDSMGDYSRFPKTKEKKNNIMKRMIQKILLWWSFVKPKKNDKSIWKL